MDSDGVETVREAVDALNRGLVDDYEAVFAPTCERLILGVGEPVPAAAPAETVRELARAFRNFRLDAELLLDCDDRVVARWRGSGFHEGEYQGVAPTGLSVSTQTCEIYQLNDVLVTATWSYGDPLDLVRQPGADR